MPSSGRRMPGFSRRRAASVQNTPRLTADRPSPTTWRMPESSLDTPETLRAARPARASTPASPALPEPDRRGVARRARARAAGELPRRRAHRRARHGRLGHRRRAAAGARASISARACPSSVVRGYTAAGVRRRSARWCSRRRTAATPRRPSRRFGAAARRRREVRRDHDRRAAAATWRASASVPALAFDWDGEPRSALGWSFASLLAICGGLGLLPDLDVRSRARRSTACATLARSIGRDVPERRNPAKQLARRLAGRLPVFIGAEALAPVAYRWRTQINENAKSWAIADELPEMNHNAPARLRRCRQRCVPLLHVVLLRHAADASAHRAAHRRDVRADAPTAGVDAEIVDVPGATRAGADALGRPAGRLGELLPGPAQRRATRRRCGALDWLKRYLADADSAAASSAAAGSAAVDRRVTAAGRLDRRSS